MAETPESMIEVVSPYDGSRIGSVPRASAADVERAVDAARSVMTDDPMAPYQRAEILDKAAALLRDRQEDFARTIAMEAAKPIKTARVEAARAVSTFQFSAAVARTLTGEMVPLDASDVGTGKLGFVLRVPVGVVGAISPFNFPLNLVAHKIAPGIAAGCAVVLKPASQTPLSAIKLADLLRNECGLPPGWLHVVPGSGGEVGNAIVDHPDIALITFTGSPPVGWGIRERAPRKRVGLELGNNAPAIIEPSADWRTAAAKIKVAGFSHAGQSCISTQRVFVHRSIHDDFVATLVDAVASLVIGDPLDEITDVSALISPDDTERVKSWIDEAVAAGAKVMVGGEVQGRLLEPAVLTDVTPDMKVCSEEVFGPVVAVAAYDDVGEALRLANDTHYGLQAAIFTNELDVALRAARTLDFGGVLVNEVPTWRADQMPYGGVRDSGNTREGPAYAVREMTEERLVVINSA
ncbi:MAG TPA: aldehyde dehydrogenase family protein [Acidimicrobiales bacterium]|jgi:acyl-CoA reductase-like NAD-dependent aldehyde dehydrogenase|nr:aldehyde dehydrogenase family protein [Acidimicrobiales bacterium]